ncbi:hypothetical protein Sango_2517200 [Sesamum angolense]|uniref:R domain-containing protein n=1 Tax=Sesamum angolense TaxID=2727404 RepID=A0AAE2BID9_9LAMI|nr:hypothetical protein Sango_2517200 [Sesamum angolense]
MEVDQIQCKFPRISNGNLTLLSAKLGRSRKWMTVSGVESKRGTANDSQSWRRRRSCSWARLRQPSKAVEWLLKAAASSIAELPPMISPFPDTPKQLSDDKRSSTGGSDQWVSTQLRSENRIKARERAKERVASEKEGKENESSHLVHRAVHKS